MNVRDAVALMAKNPAVGFPWEGALVSLVNGFLPQANQLDPITAEAKEILDAIELLEPSVKEMIYGSSLGNVNVAIPLPAPAPIPAAGPMNPVTYHQLMLGGVGAALTTVVVIMALRGSAAADILEMLKLLVSLVTGT